MFETCSRQARIWGASVASTPGRFGGPEATEFTPWLPDRIEELNEALGVEIELSGREERVGPFAVDLYGTEVQTGNPAIIENHLGARVV